MSKHDQVKQKSLMGKTDEIPQSITKENFAALTYIYSQILIAAFGLQNRLNIKKMV